MRPFTAVATTSVLLVSTLLAGDHGRNGAGQEASPQVVTRMGSSIFSIDCGPIAESWDETDLFGLLQQIGPNPPAVILRA